MVTQLISRRDLQRARDLVESSGLAFEENVDVLVGIFEAGALVATAARQGNILKMFAIAPQQRGGTALGELATELIRGGTAAGCETFFIYTAPANAPAFQALNFSPLVHHPQAMLLEYGGGLPRYLAAHRHLVRPGRNGAVVVNCNPFTRGHRFLIEQAVGLVDHLFVFVVREDRSAFPFAVRLKLVEDGVRDLANVTVLDSSHYAVSAVTFPAYFLKDPDAAATVQMEIDLMLFGRHIAPCFHIDRRFIGTEPYCRTTRRYGETMRRLLPDYGIEMVQVERLQAGAEAVSAWRVREALRREAYEELRRLVPPSTLDFLRSDAAREIRAKLRSYDRRH
jgi:[citrate (pro-3S)-lyase] ligase